MKTYGFQLPRGAARLALFEPGESDGNRELHDRIHSAFYTRGLNIPVPRLAWTLITPEILDIAATAAVIADHLGIDPDDLTDWTLVGVVNIDGHVWGGIADDGHGDARPIRTVVDLYDRLVSLRDETA